MKILITGGNGQLASDLKRIARAQGVDIDAPGRKELDITDEAACHQYIKQSRPDIIVNAAAYTAVDKAEEEPEYADAINHQGAKNIARSCEICQIPMVHISTDYVFDGEKATPYTEDDKTAPAGVYGETKLAGEKAVRQLCSRHIILRVAWVFGFYGSNFVKTMQRLARERDVLNVVSDQKGCPTSTRAISEAILCICHTENPQWGTYHYCCKPPSNWYEFARMIIEETVSREPLKVLTLNPIASSQYPTPAKRPANSVLNCDKIARVFGVEQPDWRDELRLVVNELADERHV